MSHSSSGRVSPPSEVSLVSRAGLLATAADGTRASAVRPNVAVASRRCIRSSGSATSPGPRVAISGCWCVRRPARCAGLGFDPAGLVVACRRIVERHPNSGPLWWLCASVLAAPDPYRACAGAWPTTSRRIRRPMCSSMRCPTTRRSAVVGWPDLIGEAVLRRGDSTVLAIDTDDDGMGSVAFVRRLQRCRRRCRDRAGRRARRGRAGQRSRGRRGVGRPSRPICWPTPARVRSRRSATALRYRCGPSSVAVVACRRRCSRRWVERPDGPARAVGGGGRGRAAGAHQLDRRSRRRRADRARHRCSRSARCRTSCSAPAPCDVPKYCRAMASKRSQITMTDDEVQAYLESERCSTSPRSARPGIRMSWRCGTRWSTASGVLDVRQEPEDRQPAPRSEDDRPGRERRHVRPAARCRAARPWA